MLNVGGAGWVDVFENTETLALRCSWVDGLIDAGVLVGDKYNPSQNTGLCTTDAWKEQASYPQFASIGRWVLDPADTANFTRKLAGRKTLLQEVVKDAVVSNLATDKLGALLELGPLTADSDDLGVAAPVSRNHRGRDDAEVPEVPVAHLAAGQHVRARVAAPSGQPQRGWSARDGAPAVGRRHLPHHEPLKEPAIVGAIHARAASIAHREAVRAPFEGRSLGRLHPHGAVARAEELRRFVDARCPDARVAAKRNQCGQHDLRRVALLSLIA